MNINNNMFEDVDRYRITDIEMIVEHGRCCKGLCKTMNLKSSTVGLLR